MKKQLPIYDREEHLLEDIRLPGKILGDIAREFIQKASTISKAFISWY